MANDSQKDLHSTKIDRFREDDRRIPIVEEIFHNIVKSIKTIGIYKHNKDRYTEFVEPAYKLIEKFLNQNEALIVKVEPYSFKFLDAEVYKDTDQYSNISYKFFRDGVRRISFKKGLTLNEFLQFILIISGQSHTSKQAEDIVSQLWLANLENIELTVIEGGITFGDSSENEDAKIELDTIVNFLEHKLASTSSEAVGFARLSAADIGLELDSVDYIKGLTKKPDIISDENKQRIQEFFLSENELSKIERIKRILLIILKSNINDIEFQDILENYVLMLDYILLLDDIAKAAEFFKELEQESINTSLSYELRERITQLKQRLKQELNTDLRLERIFQILKTKRIENDKSILAIVNLFDENTYTKLPKLIEQIELQDNLNILLNSLKNPRPNYETLWISLLNSKKINLVTTALNVLKDLRFEGKIEAIKPLLNSQVDQIVLKSLEIIASEDSEESEKEILRYLETNKAKGRDNILKIIHLLNEESQANIILRMLLDEKFSIDDSQRTILYTKMADLLELPQVESYFDSVFNEKGTLFTRGKLDERKRLVIKALTSSPSLITYQYLIKQSKNDNCSDTIKKELVVAAELIKKKLQGR